LFCPGSFLCDFKIDFNQKYTIKLACLNSNKVRICV